MQGPILVVDPLVIDRFRTVRSLESAGYTVSHADSASAALRYIFAADALAAVLVELDLPDFGAPTLLAAAQQECASPPPFMILVRGVDDLDIVGLRKMGFSAVMSKPLSLPLMERALANAQEERESDAAQRPASYRRRLPRRRPFGRDSTSRHEAIGMHGKRDSGPEPRA